MEDHMSDKGMQTEEALLNKLLSTIDDCLNNITVLNNRLDALECRLNVLEAQESEAQFDDFDEDFNFPDVEWEDDNE